MLKPGILASSTTTALFSFLAVLFFVTLPVETDCLAGAGAGVEATKEEVP
jgi:hypothetical protein